MTATIIITLLIIVTYGLTSLIYDYRPTKQRTIDFFRLNRFTKSYRQRAEDIQWDDAVRLLLYDFESKYGEPKEEVYDSPIYRRNGLLINFETRVVGYLESKADETARFLIIRGFLKSGHSYKVRCRISDGYIKSFSFLGSAVNSELIAKHLGEALYFNKKYSGSKMHHKFFEHLIRKLI